MAFTNLQVALTELPSFEDVEFDDLDPSYAWLVCLVVVLVELVLSVIAIIVWWELEVPGKCSGVRRSAGAPRGRSGSRAEGSLQTHY